MDKFKIAYLSFILWINEQNFAAHHLQGIYVDADFNIFGSRGLLIPS